VSEWEFQKLLLEVKVVGATVFLIGFFGVLDEVDEYVL
jgi:hypothetical protein